MLSHAPGRAPGARGGANPSGRDDAAAVSSGSEFAKFEWARERVFDEAFATTLFESVRSAEGEGCSGGRRASPEVAPHLLNTLEMQKRLNRAIASPG